MPEDVWSTNGITVRLPDGTTRSLAVADAASIKAIAKDAGLKKFTVEVDGEVVSPNDLDSLASGVIVFREYIPLGEFKTRQPRLPVRFRISVHGLSFFRLQLFGTRDGREFSDI